MSKAGFFIGVAYQEGTDPRHLRLLRGCTQRPDGRPAHKRNKFSSLHPTTCQAAVFIEAR
jgi:hypothetical protein